MKRVFKWFAIVGFVLLVGLAITVYGVSYVWPCHDWDLRLPSPDGRYDLVVLRGDAAAFADFSYRIYVFPHSQTPPDRPKGTFVWYTPFWRSSKYLVYSGYNTPLFRWTDPHSITIDIGELYTHEFTFEPVKRFSGSDEAVLVSVAFNKDKDYDTDTIP